MATQARRTAAVIGWALALGALLAPGVARAQMASGCLSDGGAVRLVAEPGVPGGAEATLDVSGARIIRYDPAFWATASPMLRRFVLLHECAHHALGHVPAPMTLAVRTPEDEQAADCYALRLLLAEGWSPDEVTALRAEMARALGPASGARASGADRAERLSSVCPRRPATAAEALALDARRAPVLSRLRVRSAVVTAPVFPRTVTPEVPPYRPPAVQGPQVGAYQPWLFRGGR